MGQHVAILPEFHRREARALRFSWESAEARLEPRQRKIKERAQFGRHKAIWRVHKTNGLRRRLEILQQRYEFTRFDRFGGLIRRYYGDADAGERGIASRLVLLTTSCDRTGTTYSV